VGKTGHQPKIAIHLQRCLSAVLHLPAGVQTVSSDYNVVSFGIWQVSLFKTNMSALLVLIVSMVLSAVCCRMLWNVIETANLCADCIVICRFGKNAKIVHFIGSMKPWQAFYNTDTGRIETSGDISTHRAELLQHWWSIFMQYVKPVLTSASVRLQSYFNILYTPRHTH